MRLTADRAFRGADGYERAAAIMREVPGFEGFRLPERYAIARDFAKANRLDMNEAIAGAQASALEQHFARLRGEDAAAGKLGVNLDANAAQQVAQLNRQADSLGKRIAAQREKVSQAQKDAKAARRERNVAEVKADKGVKTNEGRFGRVDVNAARAAGKQEGAAKAKLSDIDKARRAAERRYDVAQRNEKLIKDLKPGKAFGKDALTRDPVARLVAESGKLDEVAKAEGIGAVPKLMLGDKMMNTPEAALARVGEGQDLWKAMKDGDLRFVRGDADPGITALANQALLPAIVTSIELAKRLSAHGLIAPKTLTTHLANYVRAFYDAPQLRRAKLHMAEQAMEVARLRAIDALEKGRDAGKVAAAFQKEMKSAAKMFGDAARAEKAFGRRHGIVGPISVNSLKQASAKYRKSPAAQFEMGRWEPKRLHETLARDFVEKQRLVAEFDIYERLAKHHTLGDGKSRVVLDIVGDDIGKLEGIVRTQRRVGLPGSREKRPVVRYKGKQWVLVDDAKIPGTSAKKYGALAGKWMHLETYNYMHSAFQVQSALYGKFLAAWRTNKVVNNIASHTHILYGNVVNQHLDGGTAGDLARAYRAIGTKDPTYRAFAEAGGANGMMVNIEFSKGRNIKDGIAEVKGLFDDLVMLKETESMRSAAAALARATPEQALGAYQVLTHSVFGFGGYMRRQFERHEVATRFAIFVRNIGRAAKEKGTSTQAALKDKNAVKRALDRADELQFDYADIPRWAQFGRTVPFVGIPFLAYPVKATALFTKAAVLAPVKSRALLAASELWYDLASQKEKEQRDLAPPWQRGYRVPLGEISGINVRYLAPAENPITILGGLASDKYGQFGSQFFKDEGDFLKGTFEVMVNHSTFTGNSIVEPTDTSLQAAFKIFAHITANFGPGWFDRFVRQLVPKVLGEPDFVRGKDRSSFEIVLHTWGIRIDDADTEMAIRWMEHEFNRRESRIKKEYKEGARRFPDKEGEYWMRYEEKLQKELALLYKEMGPKFH
jgi:hypothetical protein